MARAQKLKVYRTPIGFHDAYVAAPSQKAALEAWGTAANLFARGSAELVTDAELVRDPLANPGKVIKRSRGSIEEQLAALPADHSVSRRSRHDGPAKVSTYAFSEQVAPAVRAKPRPKPKPKPSRAKLDQAEQMLADLLAKQESEIAELREREEALHRERREVERRQDRERRKAEVLAETERKAHAEALRQWR